MPAPYKTTAAIAVALSCLIATTAASFSSSSDSNVAIYWGQNSYAAATGASNAQQRLSYYCSSKPETYPLPPYQISNAEHNSNAYTQTPKLTYVISVYIVYPSRISKSVRE